MDNIAPMLTQFGVAGLLFVVLMIILKWVLTEMGRILEKEDIERKKWQEIILGFQNCIQEHSIQAKQFHESVSEAHKFQREEHREILAGVSEFKIAHNTRQAESKKICDLLDELIRMVREQFTMLQKMNGTK